MASPMVGIRCRGFKGWSLSGWSSFHLSLVGRRPTSISDNPTWNKDAHLPRPSYFDYKACFDKGDFVLDDDSDIDSEDEAEDCDSQLRRCLTPYYGDLEEEAIKEIEKYIFEVCTRLNEFPYEIKLAVPDPVRKRHHKTYACLVGCPVPFDGSVPLLEHWKQYLEERDHLSDALDVPDSVCQRISLDLTAGSLLSEYEGPIIASLGLAIYFFKRTTDDDLHTKQTGHTEFQDKTAEMVKEISLEFPKAAAMDVDEESPAGASSGTQPQGACISVVGGAWDSADRQTSRGRSKIG
ncbi:hypothetical protein Tsubulata_047422 [Turnera subulata]|uniref:Uncharacterized protein n=1 Tax=Turnera subulata TaxID=218843 RepID=A0A9Q0JKN5_9ROSI|nr:hypothetical protein Tsubulata_047422 [Turnera subulata]